MSSAYTLYPQVWIRHGLLPSLPKPLPSLKFACPFLFSSRGTLWDGKQIHPQPSVPSLKQAFPITLNSGKFISYASFWLFWFPGHSLAHFAIRCRHGLEKWPACRNRIEALLSRLVVHGSFSRQPPWPFIQSVRGSRITLRLSRPWQLCWECPFYFKVRPTFPACRESPIPSLLSCPASFSATCAPFWLHASLLFQFPKAWEQSCCWLLKYYPSISSVFQKPKP